MQTQGHFLTEMVTRQIESQAAKSKPASHTQFTSLSFSEQGPVPSNFFIHLQPRHYEIHKQCPKISLSSSAEWFSRRNDWTKMINLTLWDLTHLYISIRTHGPRFSGVWKFCILQYLVHYKGFPNDLSCMFVSCWFEWLFVIFVYFNMTKR